MWCIAAPLRRSPAGGNGSLVGLLAFGRFVVALGQPAGFGTMNHIAPSAAPWAGTTGDRSHRSGSMHLAIPSQKRIRLWGFPPHS
jgi:hypothetical protein